jgi:hypothetical protein
LNAKNIETKLAIKCAGEVGIKIVVR